MRITRDTLLRTARTAVQQMVFQDRRLVCVYLTGSFLTGDVLMGGIGDIDLICIHDTEPAIEREVKPVTDEIHLDIAHYSQKVFNQPRHLRLDPWLGSFMCQNPLALHDTQHWFEFTQASIFAQFQRPENILQRAMPMAESARLIWLELHQHAHTQTIEQIWLYLKALEKASNAIALLNGPPLTERRFMLTFPQRVEIIQRPGLASGLVDLFLDHPLSETTWSQWIQQWNETLSGLNGEQNCPVSLKSCRLPYYQRAVETLVDEHPDAALWILLRTWTRAVRSLPPNHPHIEDWLSVLRELNLEGNPFQEKIAALDNYLDNVEETLDLWAKQAGVQNPV